MHAFACSLLVVVVAVAFWWAVPLLVVATS